MLDREARSSTLLADPHHGRIREPLLKVLHLMRAQDFASRGGQEVEFEGLTSKIGQMVHEAPSVFSFYESDYAPEGVVLQSGPEWKSTSASGAPDNSSLSHFSAMTRPC